VLDPFFGSGTTGAVAQKLGRDFVGIEINPEYIDLAEKRLWGKHKKPITRLDKYIKAQEEFEKNFKNIEELEPS